MRPEGQPPSSRIVRGFLPSPRHRGRGAMTASARQRSRRSAAFAEAVCRFVISRSRLRNRCGGQQPFLLARRGGGGRNARATSRAQRALLDVSPATRSHESPAAAGSAAIIRPSQELSRFAGTHSASLCCASQHKNLLPLCRNCGRWDFFVDDRGNLSRNF